MEQIDWLKLDANEGRCLLSPSQLARVLSPEVARRYPRAELLERDLAAFYKLPPEQLIATAGADDAIERAFRILAGAGAKVLTTVPGFVEFLDAAVRAKAQFIGVKKRPGSTLPIQELCQRIKSDKPSIVVIASPDNPDGKTLSIDDFELLSMTCRAENAVFLLDLTYLDFADDTSILPRGLATPGVLITGSFSKSRGLAGFRAGWAMAGSQGAGLIGLLREAGPPFSLSSPAIEAAKIALAETEEVRALFVQRIKQERVELRQALQAAGAETWASQANFVSAFVADTEAFSLDLRKKGILIRRWPGNPDTEGLVRITCPGEEKAFNRLMAALRRPEGVL
ncbi:MAG: histidinol-phosphate transaminase [Spirochaetia bacterium]|nr:histidinol-phosphate transaminase [Spirochaetales bacterium]MDX9783336.1 histidinol-phosphate transaminase [Spirochaetia bacterium]